MNELTPQAISGITDPDQIRVVLFVNNQQVHAPFGAGVEIVGDARYLKLTGGTLSGPLLGTSATFSGAVSGAAGTFTGLLTTNGQVAFPATQNPSANANTLDDYEEGTWTPTLSFGGASVGITYGVRTGTYVKIGLEVFFEVQINLSSKGSSVGAALISGLPFAPSVNAGASVGLHQNLAANYNTQMEVTSTGLIPAATGLAASSSPLSSPDFTNTTVLIASGHYRV